MKNIFVNRIKIFAAAVSLLLICSCSDDFSGTVQDKNYPSKDGKTYLCLSAALSPEARSIAPGASDYDVTQLTNLVLTGKLSSDTGAETQLASASAYDIINGKNIPVSGAGSWTFTLTADFNGVPFKGTVEQEITEGSVNTLSFTLGTEQTQGGMSITFKFTGSSTKASDYKVNATLMNSEKTKEIDAKTFENTEDDPSAVIACSTDTTDTTFYVVYSRSVSDTESSLDADTYYLVFEVYDKRTVVEDPLNTSDSVPLNTSRNFVRVDKGITTTAELSLTLNEVYSITYNNNGGEFPEGAVIPCNYSRKSAGIILPQMVKDGYKFEGWYEKADFSGDPVQELPLGTTGNLTFWARFIETDEPEEENVLYVYPKGSETNTGSLDSIAAAVAKIIANPDPDADWTIKIDGILTGPQEISDISEDHAASLTICGANALDSEGNPADEIIADTDNPGSDALSISASLPVTIKDIKITKGEDGEDDPSYGVYVAYNSQIYLAGTPVIDDLYVENNEYYRDSEEPYGTISISEDLGDKASVTITPAYESHYPYFDDYDSHEVCITKYVFAIDGVSVADYCNKFKVTPKEEDSSTYFIDKYGRINKYISVTLESLQTGQTFNETVLYGSDPSKLDISLNEYTGWTFAGWFTSEDEGKTLKDKVSVVYEETLTLYAKWVQPLEDLYVNAGDSGSDGNAGTSTAPLKTVSAAVAKIKDFGVELDYTIHVTGMSTENTTITLDESIAFKTLIFEGAATVESGIVNKSYGSTPLVVETVKPVTLNNFVLKANSFVNIKNGALALYVGYGANVILGNGTKIYRENEDNTAAKAGVYIYDATLTMKGNSQIYGFDPGFSGNSDTNGSGGVLIEENGNLIMYDNSSIYNCRAENKGGAIHLASGSVVMNDSASIGGEGKACSASTDGGAVYMSGGDFVMNDSSSISYCTKGSNGYGSIYIAGGIFTMNGGSINNNTGGVHVEKANDSNTKVEFIMEDGSISNNGIGVYVACATNDNTSSGIFDMRGGTISDNTEHGVQVEAYVSRDVGYKSYSGTFMMSNGALVKPSNDVYLGYNSYTHPYYNDTYTSQARILITGALAGDDNNPIKATITPQNYSEDLQILEADEHVNLETEYDFFAVTSQKEEDDQGNTTTTNWTISSDGKLAKQE